MRAIERAHKRVPPGYWRMHHLIDLSRPPEVVLRRMMRVLASDSDLYQHGGRLVHVVSAPRPTIVECTAGWLRERLMLRAICVHSWSFCRLKREVGPGLTWFDRLLDAPIATARTEGAEA